MQADPKDQTDPGAGASTDPSRKRESRSQRFVNVMMRGVLRSPVHRIVSGRILVIVVTGRKTGTVYRLPVGYVEHAGALLIGTAGKWRKNLPENATVTILLRGRWRQASAEVITDEDRLAGLYRVILARNPIHGKYAKIGVEPDGSPNAADLRDAISRGIAVVRLTLQTRPSSESTTTTADGTSRNAGLMMMLAAHDAFRRDLDRLRSPTGSALAADSSVLRRWEAFRDQLHIHHSSEDAALWPPLRQAASRPRDVAVIDAMESEHAAIEPLLALVDAAFASGDRAAALEAIERLAQVLSHHMDHEEHDALPLVEQLLGPRGWTAFQRHSRKVQGLKGGAVFFPWILDGAPQATVRDVVAVLPPPARILYRRVWEPRYARALRPDNRRSTGA